MTTLTLRCALVSSSLLLLAACGPDVREAPTVATSVDELSTNQALASLFASTVSAARARCLLRSLVVGANDANQRPTIDTTLTVRPQQGEWLVVGCGAQALVARVQGDPRDALAQHLVLTAQAGVGVWNEAARVEGRDAPVLTFTSAEPRATDVELEFDGLERADAVVQVAQLSLGDAARQLVPLHADDLAQVRRLADAQLALLEHLVADAVTLTRLGQPNQ